MTTVQLSSMDARLAYLALQYHLARPGSELDPETKQRRAHGLAEVSRALEPQLESAVAEIELEGDQVERLASAVAGAVTELKAYPLLAQGGRSTVPAFRETLLRLFPAVADDPDEALTMVGHLVTLRRKLERAVPTVDPALADDERPWWRFWERKGA